MMHQELVRHDTVVRSVIAGLPSRGARFYATARFHILNATILSLIRLAIRGRLSVIDIGSGFGLLGCYLGLWDPDLHYVGIEVDESRVRAARSLSQRLGLRHVQFKVGDATDLAPRPGEFEAVVMVDLLHHVPDSTKVRLLATSYDVLPRGGLMIVKDIDTRPWPKLAFTWLADVLVARTLRMSYWSEEKLTDSVMAAGFSVQRYPVSNYLPYPHMLLVGERTG
jgi:2-polyprenyl-3-methyl-5-hydroxy-6-metoxy-1,4-benzoquinol methylase